MVTCPVDNRMMATPLAYLIKCVSEEQFKTMSEMSSVIAIYHLVIG